MHELTLYNEIVETDFNDCRSAKLVQWKKG